RRGTENGAGDRRAEGGCPGLSEGGRPLSVRSYRTSRAEDKQKSCAQPGRDGCIVTLKIVAGRYAATPPPHTPDFTSTAPPARSPRPSPALPSATSPRPAVCAPRCGRAHG